MKDTPELKTEWKSHHKSSRLTDSNTAFSKEFSIQGDLPKTNCVQIFSGNTTPSFSWRLRIAFLHLYVKDSEKVLSEEPH